MNNREVMEWTAGWNRKAMTKLLPLHLCIQDWLGLEPRFWVTE